MQEGKPEDPETTYICNLELSWTGNQMHMTAGTENRTRGSLVQSKGRYATLLPAYPKHFGFTALKKDESTS